MSHKGKHNPPLSPESRRKMSESHKGKTTWIKGKHLSEETKEKLRRVHLGTHPSAETVEKIVRTHQYRAMVQKQSHLGIDKRVKEQLRRQFLFIDIPNCIYCGREMTDCINTPPRSKSHMHTCKECDRIIHNNIARRRRHKYQNEMRTYSRERYYKQRDKALAMCHNYDKRLRNEIISYYSPTMECALCGFNDVDALTVDHINGNGSKHLSNIGVKKGGRAFFLWLKRNSFPEGFRILCQNCQFITIRRTDIDANKYYSLRREIYAAYSSDANGISCVKCGFDNIKALSLDHINGGGRRERRQTGLYGKALWLHLKKNGYPDGYRVLCMNCNWLEWYKHRYTKTIK